jgi:hypothetical protein
MSIEWRSVSSQEPEEGQRCLTICKHGIIEGDWMSDDKLFTGYYWRDMEWWATAWVPIEEVL